MSQKGYEIVNQVVINSNLSSVLIAPLEFEHIISESKVKHWREVKKIEIPEVIKAMITGVQEKIEEVKKQVKIVKNTEEPLKRIQLLRRIKNRAENLTDFFESCFDEEFEKNLKSIQNETFTASTKTDVESLRLTLNNLIFDVNDEAENVAEEFVTLVSNNTNYSKYLEADFQNIRDEVVKKKALSHLESIKRNEEKLSTIENPANLLFTLKGNDLLNDIESIEVSRIEFEQLRIYDVSNSARK